MVLILRATPMEVGPQSQKASALWENRKKKKGHSFAHVVLKLEDSDSNPMRVLIEGLYLNGLDGL